MDTSSFLKRALILQDELQAQRFPNASSFAELCGCSRSTAMRTIDRLRYEFGVPLEYNESKRGYYLTKPDFSFAALPPGRDELVVLILLSELLGLIDDPSLSTAMSGLWARITNGRSDVHYDLEQIRGRFSSELTSVAKLADVDLLRLLGLSHTGQSVTVRYRSPWKHDEDREYSGHFERFHFSDGILYALFKDYRGRSMVLNVSFIRDIVEVAELPTCPPEEGKSQSSSAHWLEGFGVWSGSKPTMVEIVIKAPASRYYAAQTWHPEQEDSWENENLVRRFPAVPSPELSRRILSLGRYVEAVRPAEILREMQLDVEHLSRLCEGGRE